MHFPDLTLRIKYRNAAVTKTAGNTAAPVSYSNIPASMKTSAPVNGLLI